MDKKYKSKKGLVYLNQYHVIFCPKYRRKVLVGDIEKDLKEIFFEVANEN
jgi:putative transposase